MPHTSIQQQTKIARSKSGAQGLCDNRNDTWQRVQARIQTLEERGVCVYEQDPAGVCPRHHRLLQHDVPNEGAILS